MNKQDRVDLKGVTKTLGDHGLILARLDERSLNQNQRMDRMNRRTAGIAIGFSSFASILMASLLSAIGWPRG